MIADMLAMNDIEPVIEGESLQIAAGEVPVIGLVRVNVEDGDAPEALRLVRQYERNRTTGATPAKRHPVLRFIDAVLAAITRCMKAIAGQRRTPPLEK